MIAMKTCPRCHNTREYLGSGFIVVKCDLCATYEDAISQIMSADNKLTRNDAINLLQSVDNKEQNNKKEVVTINDSIAKVQKKRRVSK